MAATKKLESNKQYWENVVLNQSVVIKQGIVFRISNIVIIIS